MLQEFSVRSENNNNIKFFRVIIIRFLRTIGVSDLSLIHIFALAGTAARSRAAPLPLQVRPHTRQTREHIPVSYTHLDVYKRQGYNSMGMDEDDLILAPYTTVQKRILAITHLQSITCSALSEEYTETN